MSYRAVGENIEITLTRGQFELLLLGLGIAAGNTRIMNREALFRRFIGLANTVNEGNPDWTPYAIPEEVSQ